jgi:hypothetical protein
MAYDLAPPPPPPPPFTGVSKLDRRHTGRLRKRDNLRTGEGGGDGREAESYDPKKTWSSLNQVILCAVQCTVHIDYANHKVHIRGRGEIGGVYLLSQLERIYYIFARDGR